MKRLVLCSIWFLLLLPTLAGAQGLEKAWQLLNAGERDRAKEIAAPVLANSQNEKAKGEALLLLALCEENGQRVLEQLNRFVKDFPDHPLRWRAEFEMGLHYYAMGTYRGAAKHFENAKNSRPGKQERVRASYWLGLALEAAGDGARARQQFETVRIDDAGTGLNELATLGLGDCLRAQGDYSTALSEYMRVVTNFSRSNWLPCALYGAGVCLTELGRENEAQEVYARLRREFPGSFEATLARDRAKVPAKGKTIAAGAKSYAVQLGAFSQESNANALAGLLRDEGVGDVRILREERGGRNLYIVGLGEFPTKEAASRRGKELSTRFGLSYSIVAK